MQSNNKRKEIILKVESIERVWLNLISGLSNLTEREIDVLVVLLKKRTLLIKEGLKQPYISQILLSTESRKQYYLDLGITEYNFTNLLGSLRKKQAIRKVNDVEDLYHRLIPAEEMLIKFELQHDGSTEDRSKDLGEQKN